MSTRAKKKGSKQEQNPLKQILLPMVSGMLASRQCLQQFVYEQGLLALQEVFTSEAEEIAGPKGKRQADRRHNHWGSTDVELPFGGRHIVTPRPRVRSRDGGEVTLPSVAVFRQTDPLPERVVEQIALGVSTRGYEDSLEPAPELVRERCTSKSTASRKFIECTEAKLTELMSRPLETLELVALMMDGLQVLGRTLVIALGITNQGEKVPLGLWLGSTENHTLCTQLLNNLFDRGLRVQHPLLCVIDGGRGLRKALSDVLGTHAWIQRCQVHKMRNVTEQLPAARQAYVGKQLRDAYRSGSYKLAKKKLKQLQSWLEANGEPGAEASLGEGMEETLTVLKLGLRPALTRSLSTTNAIENLIGAIRRTSRNVKRWRDGDMIERWAAFGIDIASRRFRRLKGHKDIPELVARLKAHASSVDDHKEVA